MARIETRELGVVIMMFETPRDGGEMRFASFPRAGARAIRRRTSWISGATTVSFANSTVQALTRSACQHLLQTAYTFKTRRVPEVVVTVIEISIRYIEVYIYTCFSRKNRVSISAFLEFSRVANARPVRIVAFVALGQAPTGANKSMPMRSPLP